VALFDQMRRKRHRIVYETARLVGEKEAQEALDLAREYVHLLSELATKDLD